MKVGQIIIGLYESRTNNNNNNNNDNNDYYHRITCLNCSSNVQ